jgi:hypothetical protein
MMEKNRGRTIRQICGRTIVRTLLLVGLALALSLGQVSARWVAAHAAGESPAPVSPAKCSPVVKQVPSPNPGSLSNTLRGIAAVNASDIWAVGDFSNHTGPGQTLIEHWTGSSWSWGTGQNPGSLSNTLRGIAAVNASDLWAVGDYRDTTGPIKMLIEHWNGSSWSMVTVPNPGSAFNILWGIAAVNASDIWAVGGFSNPTGPSQTLIEHLVGSSWSQVPSPSPGSASNFLWGIAAVNASDLWAVGDYRNPTSPGQTLIEHWNGFSWSWGTGQNPGSLSNTLRGIAAVNASDLWAVGDYRNTIGPRNSLIEHNWIRVPGLFPGSVNNFLRGIAEFFAGILWAVGRFQNTTGPGKELIERWDGFSWIRVPGPSPGSIGNELDAIARASVSPGILWAVGGFSNLTGPDKTLIEIIEECPL